MKLSYNKVFDLKERRKALIKHRNVRVNQSVNFGERWEVMKSPVTVG